MYSIKLFFAEVNKMLKRYKKIIILVVFSISLLCSNEVYAAGSLWERVGNSVGNTYQNIKSTISGETKNVVSWTNKWEKNIEDLYNLNKKVDDIDDPAIKKAREENEERIASQKKLEEALSNRVKESVDNYLSGNKDKLDKLVKEIRYDAGNQNGSQNKPFDIEPNQFKKICGENTYVLFWRIGGASGRDLTNPAGSFQKSKDSNWSNIGTKQGYGSSGDESVWRIPTCDELASCHCCQNLCADVVLRKIGKAMVPVCVTNVGFGINGCTPACKVPVARAGCDSYNEPVFGQALDHDCLTKLEGCKNPSGCKVIIRDPNSSGLQYAYPDNPTKFYQAKGGDISVPPGGLVKKDSGLGDAQDKGWIGQLDAEPGKCCKCMQR